MDDFGTAWSRSTTGELSWLAPDGPTGIPVVPLDRDGTPCAALPLAHLDAVDSMASRRVAFSVTGADPAVVANGHVGIELDVDGTRFVNDLLEQEIIKHPPTRLRADSMLARRENFWWIARALVTLHRADEVRPLPQRTPDTDALLVRPSGETPRVDVVTAASWPAQHEESIELWRRDGGSLQGAGEAAFCYGHQYSPDFERWERWYRAGTVHGETLTVRTGLGHPEAEPAPFGFLERYRNHRDVARACKEGLAKAEARMGQDRES
ncbi:hypothetical protein F4561_002323 [Lipingzhangella halophila]|uniref:Uncharacterized protein n=1 Tax=Lipingzhangella halophila TaxID=1783352 RepID=A0A7W7RGE3_9ACTN|nr:hypothetical protein [Lipingzhangella halophila]MBB4931503.1 hypothetical protein [Lipingzhangella halophila]